MLLELDLCVYSSFWLFWYQNLEFRILAFQNIEFRILASQNIEFRILAFLYLNTIGFKAYRACGVV